jgi:hypothetical protein
LALLKERLLLAEIILARLKPWLDKHVNREVSQYYLQKASEDAAISAA